MAVLRLRFSRFFSIYRPKSLLTTLPCGHMNPIDVYESRFGGFDGLVPELCWLVILSISALKPPLCQAMC
jgi:hypothetical protein